MSWPKTRHEVAQGKPFSIDFAPHLHFFRQPRFDHNLHTLTPPFVANERQVYWLKSESADMKHLVRSYFRDERGAVTVDWVVLTAAVVALGVAAAAALTTGTTELSDDIWAYMDSLDLFE